MFLDTTPFRYFHNFRVVKSCLSVYSCVSQISVHSVNLCNIFAAGFWTYIHIQLLMSAILTIRQCQVYSFIKSHLHCPADQRFDCLFVVGYRIAAVLNFTAIEQIPESLLIILFLYWRDVFCNMAMETIAHILAIRHTWDNPIFLPELLDL